MKVLRTQKSAYALSLIFCLLGITTYFIALLKTWSRIVSAEDPFSTFLTLLWTEKLNFISNIEFKLAYLVIFGDMMFISAVIVWILSRQWFLLPGKTVWFQCPFCKRKWRSTRDKALVHCPHCRQLVHPTMTEK